jgi:predicted RNA-binding protein YlxR (DUF448 family)
MGGRREAGGGPDGPADEEERGPLRRCLVTGAVRPKEEMVRFVVGPDGRLVPDVEERLPGRGLWLSAGRDMVNTAAAKGLFAKAARRAVDVPPDLADRVEALLARRCLDLLGLARRAGEAAGGFEKARAWLAAGTVGVVVTAADGAADGRRKLLAGAPEVPVVALFGAADLAAATGRDHVVHVAVREGRIAERLRREAARLAGFRRPPAAERR